MSKRKVVRAVVARGKAVVVTAVDRALRITWKLKGHLKNAQVAFVRVCVTLAQVRDEKIYKDLKHPDMESYAEERVRLGRSSLYKYLKVHDWLQKSHPEWLVPKPKGFIPDLSDAVDLMWIEGQLERPNLDPKTRAALEELRDKALNGSLRQGDLAQWRRRRQQPEDALKSYLSRLRLLRRRGAELASMPREVIAHLDAAIEILKNDHTLHAAGLHVIRGGKTGLPARKYSAIRR
jgi:hypothetical protein